MSELALFGGDNLLTQLEAADPRVREEIRRILNQQATDEALALLKSENEALRRRVVETEDTVSELSERVKDVQDAGARKLLHSEKYYTRTALGDLFAPAIKNQHMTRLLRVVGILATNDVVREQYTRGGEPIAKRKPWSDYPTWVFHIGKTKARIDRWLEANGHYDAFHATATKAERDAFIDMLFGEYCG